MKWFDLEYAREIATRLEATRSTDARGRVSFSGWESHEYMTLITAILMATKEIPPLEKSRIVQKAIRTSARNGEVTADTVLREASRLEGRFVTKKKEPFVLASSLSISRFTKLPRFRLSGATITVAANLPPQFFREAERLRLDSPYSTRLETPDRYSRIRIAVRAASSEAAGEIALSRLDLFRAFINLFVNRSYGTPIMPTWPKPVNRVLAGPFHTLHEPSGKAASSTFWYSPSFDSEWSPYDLQKHEMVCISFIKNAYGALKKVSYRSKLEEWLVQYTKALDEADWYSSFLRLWNLLEQLVVVGRGDGNDVAIRRASFVWVDALFQRKVLKLLKEVRNQTVHSSRPETSEDLVLVHQLRNTVEMLLEFHLTRGGQFSSIEDVRTFLSHPPDERDLKIQLEITSAALRYRSRAK